MLAAMAPVHAQTAAETEFFESRIRPLLAEKCQSCHGPEQSMGGLDFSPAGGLVRKPSPDHAAEPIVSRSDPDNSPLLRAVRYQGKIKMPPTGKLAGREIADLARWVKMGAPWPKQRPLAARSQPLRRSEFTEEERGFWAFQPVQAYPPPEVRDTKWVRTAVDNFVLARLEAAGVKPAPPVGRLTLLRRVSYDLTGLPPSERDIEDFLRDESPGAYPKVVERLLASPHYGERWGRHWLDVARYADSTGVDEDTKYPYAWKYRDYVIEAFNEDLPYDRFVQEQIAGDLLPAAQPGELNARGIIATGFLALGPKLIAEQDKKKMLYDIIDEQIEVVGKALLGLTLQCARCHDHKFDPIRTRDYYSLASIFASTRQLDDPKAFVAKLYFAPLVPAEVADRYFDHQKKIAAKKQEVDNIVAEQSERAVMRRLPKLSGYLIAARRISSVAGANSEHGAKSAGAGTAAGAEPEFNIQSVAAEFGLESDILEKWVAYLKPTKEVRPHLDRLLTAGETSLPDVARQYQKEFQQSAAKKFGGLAEWREKLRLALAKGEKVPERPRFFAGENRFFTETSGGKGPFGIGKKDRQKEFSSEALSQLTRLEEELEQFRKSLPPQPPMADAVAEDKPVEQHVFITGNVRQLGEAVPKAFPAILTPEGTPPKIVSGSGRLELAQWLASPRNPLTARVMVNRVWKWHFGEGIVRTPNNFGKVGERPTHPKLLDYLASEFIRKGWSVKEMHRLIVLSSSYRMSAETTQAKYDSDPDNRLWSRFQRRRMDIEEIRDSLLVLEGRLDDGMGGTLQLGIGLGMTTTNQLPPLDVSKIYRRTVYLPLRRANIPKLLTLFDFGDGVTSNGARARTNVAPQALFMMNGEFVSRVAEALARRLLAVRRVPEEERVRRAWRIVLATQPDRDEMAEALDYIRDFQRSAAGKDLVPVESSRQGERHLSSDQPAYYYGESVLRAWRSYCKVLIASNDFIYIQ